MSCFPKIEFVGWKIFFRNIRMLFIPENDFHASDDSSIVLNENDRYNIEEPLIDRKYKEYLWGDK